MTNFSAVKCCRLSSYNTWSGKTHVKVRLTFCHQDGVTLSSPVLVWWATGSRIHYVDLNWSQILYMTQCLPKRDTATNMLKIDNIWESALERKRNKMPMPYGCHIWFLSLALCRGNNACVRWDWPTRAILGQQCVNNMENK